MSYQSLNNFETHEIQAESIERKSHSARVPILLLMISVVSISAIVLLSSKSMNTKLLSSDLKKSSGMKWTLQRKDYDPIRLFAFDKESLFSYRFLDDAVAVIEPFADMQLYVENYDSSSSNHYEFRICDSNGVCPTGSLKAVTTNIIHVPVSFGCKSFDKLSITVRKYDSVNGDILEEDSGTAICTYVRREIRALSSADLSATMDSMFKLWSTDEEEGRMMYGDDFHNITYLLQMHHFNAAWPDSDHFHEVVSN